MRIVRIAIVALFAAFAAPAARAAAQAEEVAVSPWVEAGTQRPDSAARVPAAAQTAASAFQRTAQPRTLRAYWHVFTAFAVAWVLLFGYVVVLARRFRRLEEQVRGS